MRRSVFCTLSPFPASLYLTLYVFEGMRYLSKRSMATLLKTDQETIAAMIKPSAVPGLTSLVPRVSEFYHMSEFVDLARLLKWPSDDISLGFEQLENLINYISLDEMAAINRTHGKKKKQLRLEGEEADAGLPAVSKKAKSAVVSVQTHQLPPPSPPQQAAAVDRYDAYQTALSNDLLFMQDELAAWRAAKPAVWEFDQRKSALDGQIEMLQHTGSKEIIVQLELMGVHLLIKRSNYLSEFAKTRAESIQRAQTLVTKISAILESTRQHRVGVREFGASGMVDLNFAIFDREKITIFKEYAAHARSFENTKGAVK